MSVEEFAAALGADVVIDLTHLVPRGALGVQDALVLRHWFNLRQEALRNEDPHAI